jgi:hypothetical protein
MTIFSLLPLVLLAGFVVLVVVSSNASKRIARRTSGSRATGFSKVEAEFQKLKGQFEAGALTEAEFKARLEDLMIQDEEGRWWMIGYETGQWYHHNGEQWVRGEPPPVAERRREVEALCREGAAALAAEEWEAAIEKFEVALALEPGHPEASAGLAQAKAGAAKVVQPETPVEPMPPPPTRLKVSWRWVAAGVAALVVVALVLLLSGGPGAGVAFWAEPDVIPPGGCTILHWRVEGVEHVYLYGPPDYELQWAPPEGEKEACLGESATYELKNPDAEVIATTYIEVRE